ncbi:MAG: MFS transporter, partial [Nonomuraea sp.]|nr:MFS transporter [Nonomuraea sp.]
GPIAALGATAAAFAAGSVLVAWALPRGVGRPVAQQEPLGYWRSQRESLAFVRGEPLLLALMLMIGVTNLLDAAFSQVLAPVWGRESGYGPAAIGLNSAVMGAAAVVGSLAATAFAHRLPRRTVFFVAFLIAGAPRFLVLASGAPLWSTVAVFAVSGLASGFLNPIIGAVEFERIPRHLLGRVTAFGDSMAWAGIPLGGLLAGLAVAWAGLVPVLVGAGAAYFVTTMAPGLRREWREMDRRVPLPAESP